MRFDVKHELIIMHWSLVKIKGKLGLLAFMFHVRTCGGVRKIKDPIHVGDVLLVSL